ncbi:phospholipase A1-Igamma2, chloroplastic-like [Cryptomeria japonica]|uniref:phospholipase A1-Igamma2, chloroplastic-like n=1 Tax=Cryptomeria japonica TaxID=3369 RepID=UPI0027DA6589|nr:phospholipase A1-Igamma2, chloroplastic-like [Cryptomeria japonica]
MLDPINPHLKAEILSYGDFAQQCYDSFDNTYSSKYYGNSKSSKSSLGRRLELLRSGRGYQPKSGYSGAWMGYIAVCTDPKEIKRLGRRNIVVAWRGTETPQEWMQNMKDILVPGTLSQSTQCPDIQTTFKPGVQTEKGFLSCYNSVYGDSVRSRHSARDIVVTEITRLLNEYKDEEDLSITFTGHSLGAALATLSAYDIKQITMKENDRKSIPAAVFAFASPRIGNLAFSEHLQEIGVKVLRLVNTWDVVPKVPGVFLNENMGWLTRFLHWFPWTYVHVGVHITLDSSRSPVLKKSYNPASFHNLEVYLHLLDGFQGNNKLPFKPSGRDPGLVNKYADLLIEKLQIPSNLWVRRNKEIVKRIDGLLVYSPTTPSPVPLTPRLLYMRPSNSNSLPVYNSSNCNCQILALS